MTALLPVRGPLIVREPWFQRFPSWSLAVSALLFAAVLTLRLLDDDPGEPVSMLYALPVALLAFTYGFRGGLVGGLLAVALMELWVALAGVDISAVGWVARALPLLLLGALLGQATDHLRRAEAERRRLEGAELLHREAIEINDSLVQGMAAAKWSFEGGQVENGLEILETTLSQAHELVSGLIRRAEMADQTHASE